MDLYLAGKWAVVTGGSRGIGFAEGAGVAILARDPDHLEAASRRLRGISGPRS